MKQKISISLSKFLVCLVTFIAGIHRFGGAFPVSALNVPVRVGYSISDPYYENLDLEYYAYGYSGGSQTFSVTMDGSPTFTVDDLLINGSTSYYNSAGNVILTSDLTLNNESFNVEGTVDLSDLDVTIESDGNSSGSIYNYYRYTYTKVQRIAITFSAPAQGYIKLTPNTGGTTESGWSYRAVSGCSVNISTADASTNTMTIRPAGNTVCVIEIYKTYTQASSITTNRFFGITNASFDDGSHLEAYEVPVSDDSSHSLLDSIVGWLEDIHDTLVQAQQGVDDTNEQLQDVSDDLSTTMGALHTIEDTTLNNMDTALNNESLNRSVSTEFNKTSPKNGLSWVSSQMTYIVNDLGTGIASFWEFSFIFPLIIGVSLLIIGRLK